MFKIKENKSSRKSELRPKEKKSSCLSIEVPGHCIHVLHLSLSICLSVSLSLPPLFFLPSLLLSFPLSKRRKKGEGRVVIEQLSEQAYKRELCGQTELLSTMIKLFQTWIILFMQPWGWVICLHTVWVTKTGTVRMKFATGIFSYI